jgi:cellulose synthase/poly-beta-1,6-N-acetylglucosamine synthase-like glycosyltransferase
VDGPVALYRRAALDDVAVPPGPHGEVFDASFFAYKEDVDLAWRLRRRGWASCYEPRAVAHHVRSARPSPGGRVRAGSELSRLADRNGFVNHRLMQVKDDRFTSLLRALPWWLVREVGAWLRLPLRDPFPVWAITGLVRGLPGALRKRRTIVRRTLVVDDHRWFR